MANNYTQFSFVVKASKDQAAWVETTMQACRDYQDGNEHEQEFDFVVFRICEGDLYPEVSVEWDNSELWFHADESGDIEFTANLIHEMLAHFNRDDKVGFTWAATCSRMRVDEFTGGAVLITKDDVEYFGASQWLNEKLGAVPAI